MKMSLSVLFSLCCAQLIAQGTQYSQTDQECSQNSRFQFGGTYSYLHFKPDANPSLHGNLGGANALYEYLPPNSIYEAASFDYKQGTLHGSSAKRTVLDFDVQGRLGYSANWHCCSTRWSLYTGLGYHYLGEKATSSGSATTYNYNEFYVPVGFAIEGSVTSWFSMGVDFQWKPQVFPSLLINPPGGANWVIVKKLNNFYVDVPFIFNVSCRYSLDLIITPFVEWWHDGRTTAKTSSGLTLNVPGNSYLYAGTKVNLAYRF